MCYTCTSFILQLSGSIRPSVCHDNFFSYGFAFSAGDLSSLRIWFWVLYWCLIRCWKLYFNHLCNLLVDNKMMCVVLFSAENPKLVSRSLTFYTLSKLWHYWHIAIHCIMFYFNNISTFQQLFLNYDCRCDVDVLFGLRYFTLNPIVKREQQSRNLLLVGYCDIINSSIFLHFH